MKEVKGQRVDYLIEKMLVSPPAYNCPTDPTAFTGLGTRIIMIGTLTGLQWWIYGSFKNLMGFGTS